MSESARKKIWIHYWWKNVKNAAFLLAKLFEYLWYLWNTLQRNSTWVYIDLQKQSSHTTSANSVFFFNLLTWVWIFSLKKLWSDTGTHGFKVGHKNTYHKTTGTGSVIKIFWTWSLSRWMITQQRTILTSFECCGISEKGLSAPSDKLNGQLKLLTESTDCLLQDSDYDNVIMVRMNWRGSRGRSNVAIKKISEVLLNFECCS